MDVPEYIEPEDVPKVMHEHACLIVPSRWEPWGVVALEAIAAGMKVVVSDKVCARQDLPVDALFPSGDSKRLAYVMLGIEKKMGANALCDDNYHHELLKKYDVAAWADRVMTICNDVLRVSPRHG